MITCLRVAYCNIFNYEARTPNLRCITSNSKIAIVERRCNFGFIQIRMSSFISGHLHQFQDSLLRGPPLIHTETNIRRYTKISTTWQNKQFFESNISFLTCIEIFVIISIISPGTHRRDSIYVLSVSSKYFANPASTIKAIINDIKAIKHQL